MKKPQARYTKLQRDIDYSIAVALFIDFADGAVYDGLQFYQVTNPWEFCKSIVRSWHASRR